MKYLLNIVIVLAAISFTSSCTKEVSTEGISRVTNFANITMNGDQTIIVPCGSDFVDPGVEATENGEPVEVVTVNNPGTYFGEPEVNTNVMDFYSIDYSATNSDGFSGSTTRNVIVACSSDLVNSFEGVYTSTVVRNGSVDPKYQNLKYVIINNLGNGKYALSDAIGGYYDFGRGYGPGYAATGVTFTVNDGGISFQGVPTGVGAFGGSLTMTEMTIDDATRTIHFISDWDAGYVFDVTLTQVDF